MPNAADIQWLKQHFGSQIATAVAGTPFSVDLMCALACQETGEVWPILRRKGMDPQQILALCVGDTLDEDRGRRAFPRTRAALEAKPKGAQMFAVARADLVAMAEHIESYAGAARNRNKFCHGFGMFQRDLQFFLEDPDYFLQRRYVEFDQTLGHCVRLLREKQRVLGWQNRTELSVLEQVGVAIAYNTGRYDPARGLRQGFRSADGRFYGEAVMDFLRLSETVAMPGTAPLIEPPTRPGVAIVPPPTPVTAQGAVLRVDTRISTLYLRSEPRRSRPPRANVVGELPDGHLVRALGTPVQNGFLAVETSLSGALLRGYAHTDFLEREPDIVDVPVEHPQQVPPTGALEAVYMPRRAGSVTRRRERANAHSLNEAGAPSRTGETAAQLCSELGAIVDWLAVDDPAHLRYKPGGNKTFCNIYCHDFCHLAGVYLPRVWWQPRALQDRIAGRPVEPLYEKTIREMVANELFRWLRDFGPQFGWRQTGTLDKLQLAANQGAVALIVARRTENGPPGHMVMVVPETATQAARRDALGTVVSPLQSQAGARNFRYGTSGPWWNDERFAEYAFWIHA